MFLPVCGNTRASTVCQGDILQIHFALANYSTEDISVTANLWFSSDPNWDTGDTIGEGCIGDNGRGG